MTNLIQFPKTPKPPTGDENIIVPEGGWAVAGGAVYWMQLKKPNILIRLFAAIFLKMPWYDINPEQYKKDFRALRDRGMLV